MIDRSLILTNQQEIQQSSIRLKEKTSTPDFLISIVPINVYIHYSFFQSYDRLIILATHENQEMQMSR